jgi:hypothetical protein
MRLAPRYREASLHLRAGGVLTFFVPEAASGPPGRHSAWFTILSTKMLTISLTRTYLTNRRKSRGIGEKPDESYFSPMIATLVYCREFGPLSMRSSCACAHELCFCCLSLVGSGATHRPCRLLPSARATGPRWSASTDPRGDHCLAGSGRTRLESKRTHAHVICGLEAAATLEGHTGAVWGVALAGDGRLLASGGVDGTVRLWEMGSGQLLATLQRHTGAVWGVALSADGGLVASGGCVSKDARRDAGQQDRRAVRERVVALRDEGRTWPEIARPTSHAGNSHGVMHHRVHTFWSRPSPHRQRCDLRARAWGTGRGLRRRHQRSVGVPLMSTLPCLACDAAAARPVPW